MKKYINNKEVVSIFEAAGQIKSGDSVWVSGNSELTKTFLNALIGRASELKDVIIIIDHPGIEPAINSMKYNGSFKVISGLSQVIRQTYDKGDKLEFIRATGKNIVEIVCRDFAVNTLVAEVLPPDANGMCNPSYFGRFFVSTISGIEGIEKRIAIVNENLVPVSEGAVVRQLPFEGFDTVCASVPPVMASIA